MIAQYRPDIARVAEETVVNLKSLENSIEVLRNDLAWLCQSIGHPEAARLALTPTRFPAVGGGLGIGATTSLLNPALGFASGLPLTHPALAAGLPFATTNPAIAFAGLPTINPYAAINPYLMSVVGAGQFPGVQVPINGAFR